MKKLLFISIFSFLISFKIAAADENKCSNFKVFTPEHNKCVKNKTKKITDFGKKSLKKLNELCRKKITRIKYTTT